MFTLVYLPNTCRFAIHARGCSAAEERAQGRHGATIVLGEEFESIEAARAEAHADESDRAGEPAKARVKVCQCAKRQ